jgi:hypothetical protein
MEGPADREQVMKMVATAREQMSIAVGTHE